MALGTLGGPDKLEALADLVQAGNPLAGEFPQVRRLGRLTPPGRVAELLRGQAAQLRRREYVGVGERRG